MKKLSTLLLIVLLFISCNSARQLYSKFGNAKQQLDKKQDNVIRIYFDRLGIIYPNINLDDGLITQNDSRLHLLYEQNKNIYKKALSKHGLSSNATYEDLQQQLIEEYITDINKRSVNKRTVFLIHGFNKHATKPEKYNAYAEYKILRDKITEQYDNIQFVEIYWDGCTATNSTRFTSFKLNTKKAWKRGQPASNNVGLELRRILKGLANEKNYVIAHSLGSSVITCALFNVEKFTRGTFMNDITAKYNNASLYATPTTTFSVGMFAPAIPGENTFHDFDKRTPKTKDIYNYTFEIGFNTNDKVLKKYINIIKHFGSTSLGALEDEVEKVKSITNINGHKTITSTDFSIYREGPPPIMQTGHNIGTYIQNPSMDKFLQKVFQ